MKYTVQSDVTIMNVEADDILQARAKFCQGITDLFGPGHILHFEHTTCINQTTKEEETDNETNALANAVAGETECAPSETA